MSDRETRSHASSDEARSQRRLPPLGRLLSDSLGDFNVVRLLSEVTAHLRAIRRFTEGVNNEVAGMHAGVLRLEDQVAELRSEVRVLGDRVLAMEQRVGDLEPHVADVSLAIRPLRRARARLPQRGATSNEERSAGH